jgi:RNA polymerase sigma-70 factor (ECF subfamily)
VQSEAVNVKISDAALIQQCIDGDSAAIEKLIIKYKDRIYNVILRICHNRDDAAELTQDTLVKIIRNIDRFEGKSSLYTWIFRIAVNLTLNHCRRQKTRQAESLDVEFGTNNDRAKASLKAFLTNDSARDPADIMQNKEQVELILKAVNSLDEEQKAVIVLRDIENMKYSQIAKVLAIELGTVKSRLSRARMSLRLKLGEILR